PGAELDALGEGGECAEDRKPLVREAGLANPSRMITEPLGPLHQLQLLWKRRSVEKAKAAFVHASRVPAWEGGYGAERAFQAAKLAYSVLRFATERRSARNIASPGCGRSRRRRASGAVRCGAFDTREVAFLESFHRCGSSSDDRITLPQARPSRVRGTNRSG